jgi:hypothetical protein
MSHKSDTAITGSIGFPSKMPGTAYGLSAERCITGGKLAKIPGSVCYGCYALGGNYLYPSVKVAHAKRHEGIDSPHWVQAMTNVLRHAQRKGVNRQGEPIQLGYHRWHDSGDIQSEEHFGKICAVARATPEIAHWIPTRELKIVLAYLAKGGTIPPNLMVRASATMVDGPAPKAWPHTSGVHKNKPAKGVPCRAPDHDGHCGPCRACWDFSVPHVSYLHHN